MYATSKLIIPPKPARNSPYIPKLRIKLRPTLSRVRTARPHHHDSFNEKAYIKSVKRRNSFENSDFLCEPAMDPSASNGISGPYADNHGLFLEDYCEQVSRSSFPSCKSSSKRKRAFDVVEDIDLDSPDSILTKINLKTVINRETFYALPIDTQRALAELLPLYDRQKQQLTPLSDLVSVSNGLKEDSSDIAEKTPETVWLHPSALSNEFFGKALQDYATRQAQGDFAQRARNRAGLRASAVGRGRYGSLTPSENSQDRLTTDISLPTASAKLKRIRQVSRSKANRKVVLSNQKTSRIRNRKQLLALNEINSDTRLSLDSRTNTSTVVSKLRRSGKNLRCTSARLVTTSKHVPQASESCPEVTVLVANPECPSSTKFRSDELSAESSTNSSSSVLEVCDRPPSPTFTIRKSDTHDSSPTSGSQLNRKSTTPLSSPRRPRQTHLSRRSPASSESPTSQTVSSPCPSRVSGANTDSQPPLSMPPPRQTKTLAAMREKLRAKRMMKEAERQGPVGSYYGLTGSMTPHPASGSCGYFHQPPGYCPAGNLRSFPSPDNSKRPSSAFSSPHGPSSVSPSSYDRPTPTTTSSITVLGLSHQNLETGFSKPMSVSPSSPLSLPIPDNCSPIPSSGADFLTRILNNDRSDPLSELCAKSYPSSPCSTISPPKRILPSCSGFSSHSVRTIPISCTDIYHEHSNSAPATPLDAHVGHAPLSSFNNSSIISPGVSIGAPVCSDTVILPHSSCHSSVTTLSVSSSYLPTQRTVVPHTQSPTFDQPVGLGATFSSSGIGSVESSAKQNHAHPLVTSPNYLPISASVSNNQNESSCVSTVVFRPSNTSATVSTAPALPQLSIPVNSGRLSTNTRAFFVDRDNLPQALALLQSLNPTATITQQQFLLIPSANKSQLFLYRAPSTESLQHNSVCSNGVTAASQLPPAIETVKVPVATVVPPLSSCAVENDWISTADQCISGNHSTTSSVGCLTEDSSALISPSYVLNGDPIGPHSSDVSMLVTGPPTLMRSLVCPSSTPIVSPLSMISSESTKSQSKLVSLQEVIREQNALKQTMPTSRVVLQQNPNTLGHVPPTTHSQLTISLLPTSSSVLRTESPLVLFSESSHRACTVQSTLPVDLIQANLAADHPVYLSTSLQRSASSTNATHMIVPQHRSIISSASPVLSCIQPSTMCVIPSVIPSHNASVPSPSNSHTPSQLMATALQQPVIRYSDRLISHSYSHFVTSSSLSPVASMFSPSLQNIQPKQTCFVLHPDHVTTANVSRQM